MLIPASPAGHPPADGSSAPSIIRLWQDTNRTEQFRRIGGMHLQCCRREGQIAREQALEQYAKLPAGTRIDVPSARAFSKCLGLFRSIGMLKHRPMLLLELSAQDMADLLGYSKSVVEAVLRWLRCAKIVYRGQVVAYGLGYINRVRRKARAIVSGVMKKVYRTSETALTELGRGLVGLLEQKKVPRRYAPPARPPPSLQTAPPKRATARHATSRAQEAPTQKDWDNNVAGIKAISAFLKNHRGAAPTPKYRRSTLRRNWLG